MNAWNSLAEQEKLNVLNKDQLATLFAFFYPNFNFSLRRADIDAIKKKQYLSREDTRGLVYASQTFRSIYLGIKYKRAHEFTDKDIQYWERVLVRITRAHKINIKDFNRLLGIYRNKNKIKETQENKKGNNQASGNSEDSIRFMLDYLPRYNQYEDTLELRDLYCLGFFFVANKLALGYQADYLHEFMNRYYGTHSVENMQSWGWIGRIKKDQLMLRIEQFIHPKRTTFIAPKERKLTLDSSIDFDYRKKLNAQFRVCYFHYDGSMVGAKGCCVVRKFMNWFTYHTNVNTKRYYGVEYTELIELMFAEYAEANQYKVESNRVKCLGEWFSRDQTVAILEFQKECKDNDMFRSLCVFLFVEAAYLILDDAFNIEADRFMNLYFSYFID